jgi:large subunit ribosomal protein L24
MHIKKGDNVIVLAGASKGKKGVVSKVMPKLNKVVIDGLNMTKKTTRAKTKGGKGSIVAMPIHASNVSKI